MDEYWMFCRKKGPWWLLGFVRLGATKFLSIFCCSWETSLSENEKKKKLSPLTKWFLLLIFHKAGQRIMNLLSPWYWTNILRSVVVLPNRTETDGWINLSPAGQGRKTEPHWAGWEWCNREQMDGEIWKTRRESSLLHKYCVKQGETWKYWP